MQRYECKLIVEGITKDNSNKKFHISLQNRRWYNGKILSFDEDCLILLEDKIGRIPVPYSLIINIEPKRSK